MKTSEIEFKAKTLDGEWVYGCYAEYKVFGEELRQTIIDRCGHSHSVDPDTVCEFTRMLDTKGKKIFERDYAEMIVINTTYYKRPFEEKFTGSICRSDSGEFYFSVVGGETKFKINDSIVVVGSVLD